MMTVPKPNESGITNATSTPTVELFALGPDTMNTTPATVTAIATQV